LDTLVFAGGIGEHAPRIRAQICGGISHLGIRIDSKRNQQNQGRISDPSSKVTVRVIPTDEELYIAQRLQEELS
jgi:acetate kinase